MLNVAILNELETPFSFFYQLLVVVHSLYHCLCPNLHFHQDHQNHLFFHLLNFVEPSYSCYYWVVTVQNVVEYYWLFRLHPPVHLFHHYFQFPVQMDLFVGCYCYCFHLQMILLHFQGLIILIKCLVIVVYQFHLFPRFHLQFHLQFHLHHLHQLSLNHLLVRILSLFVNYSVLYLELEPGNHIFELID